jgi:hypothetical protein
LLVASSDAIFTAFYTDTLLKTETTALIEKFGHLVPDLASIQGINSSKTRGKQADAILRRLLPGRKMAGFSHQWIRSIIGPPPAPDVGRVTKRRRKHSPDSPQQQGASPTEENKARHHSPSPPRASNTTSAESSSTTAWSFPKPTDATPVTASRSPLPTAAIDIDEEQKTFLQCAQQYAESIKRKSILVHQIVEKEESLNRGLAALDQQKKDLESKQKECDILRDTLLEATTGISESLKRKWLDDPNVRQQIRQDMVEEVRADHAAQLKAAVAAAEDKARTAVAREIDRMKVSHAQEISLLKTTTESKLMQVNSNHQRELSFVKSQLSSSEQQVEALRMQMNRASATRNLEALSATALSDAAVEMAIGS